MLNPELHGFLWDLDGTILWHRSSTDLVVNAAVRRAVSRLNSGRELLSAHQITEWLSAPWDGLASFLHPVLIKLLELGQVRSDLTLSNFTQLVLNEFSATVEDSVSLKENRLNEGVTQAMQRFKQNGLAQGVVSSCLSAIGAPALKLLIPNLSQIIPEQNLFFGDLVRPRLLKPHTRLYRLAACSLGIAPRLLGVVEDRPASLAGALRAGYGQAIGLIRDENEIAHFTALQKRYPNRVSIIRSICELL